MTGLHQRDAEGAYNEQQVEQRFAGQPVVLLHWALRQQGLIVLVSNPCSIELLADAVKLRFALRQSGAGSYQLLHSLMQEMGLAVDLNEQAAGVFRSEQDAALAVAEGAADVSMGLATVAKQLRLGFIPLTDEQFDLMIWRHEYFEEALQSFFACCRSDLFANSAKLLGGYNLSEQLSIRYNSTV